MDAYYSILNEIGQFTQTSIDSTKTFFLFFFEYQQKYFFY